MTVVVADDTDATEGEKETLIQRVMGWLEGKHIPIYVPIGVLVLLIALIVVLILVLSRRNRKPVVESTGNFNTSKTGYAEAGVTVWYEDEQITRCNDAYGLQEKYPSETDAANQNANGRTVHLDESHTVRLDDEDFGFGATVRLEDEDESSLDIHMEIHQAGREAERRMFTLRKDAAFVLGRKEQSDFVIHGDRAVSGSHLKLMYDGTDVYVEDMYSTNGTKLNGERIAPEEKRRVADGDVIMIAETQITLHFSR